MTKVMGWPLPSLQAGDSRESLPLALKQQVALLREGPVADDLAWPLRAERESGWQPARKDPSPTAARN